MKFIHPKNSKPEIIEKYKNMTVEHVVMRRHKGGGIEWTGSLVGKDYFLVGYMNGILGINFAERENDLYKDGVYIGQLENYESVQDLIKLLNTPPKKEENITFDDVVEFLNWKKIDNLEIQEV